MRQKVFILSAKKYSFADQNTGELKSGLTVHYVNDIKPCEISAGSKGSAPVKASFPMQEFDNLADVPNYYNIDYDITADSQGKPKFIYRSISKAS